METKTKTRAEWYADIRLIVLSYDGFGRNFEETWETEKITKEEFDRQLDLCTTISYDKA